MSSSYRGNLSLYGRDLTRTALRRGGGGGFYVFTLHFENFVKPLEILEFCPLPFLCLSEFGSSIEGFAWINQVSVFQTRVDPCFIACILEFGDRRLVCSSGFLVFLSFWVGVLRVSGLGGGLYFLRFLGCFMAESSGESGVREVVFIPSSSESGSLGES